LVFGNNRNCDSKIPTKHEIKAILLRRKTEVNWKRFGCKCDFSEKVKIS
jgi:hypothetical protein